jgi:hypothetical protein
MKSGVQYLIILSIIRMNALDRALFDAVKSGNENAVVAALEAGGNVNCFDERHYTPFFHAISPANAEPYLDIAEILIAHGADVNDPTLDGVTPLMRAFADDKIEAARFLLDHGVDIHKETEIGTTAFDDALECGRIFGNEDLIQRMIDDGADVNRRDGDLQLPPVERALTIMKVLQANPHRTGEVLVNLLLNAGADLQMEVTHIIHNPQGNDNVTKSIRAWACEGYYGERAKHLICPNGGKRRRNTRRRSTPRRSTRRRRTRRNRT